jgi:hypothetical protein
VHARRSNAPPACSGCKLTAHALQQSLLNHCPASPSQPMTRLLTLQGCNCKLSTACIRLCARIRLRQARQDASGLQLLNAVCTMPAVQPNLHSAAPSNPSLLILCRSQQQCAGCQQQRHHQCSRSSSNRACCRCSSLPPRQYAATSTARSPHTT